MWSVFEKPKEPALVVIFGRYDFLFLIALKRKVNDAGECPQPTGNRAPSRCVGELSESERPKGGRSA